MFDPKIDKSYRNSQGEFVDIYTEFRLPDGPESDKDAITQAYRNFVRACHPDVCKDKELAEAMTKFANRARAVLEMERAPYNEKWRQEKGRKKKRSNRTGTDSSSKAWTVPPAVEKAVGCIVPLLGVSAVAVWLPTLYNWYSDQLESMPSQSKPVVTAPAAPTIPAPTIPAPTVPKKPLAPGPVLTSVSEDFQGSQSRWFEVDTSKVGKLMGETEIEPGTDEDQAREIVKHKACAAFTISCQNGLMSGYSFYWLQNICPPVRARVTPETMAPEIFTYPDWFPTEVQLESEWFHFQAPPPDRQLSRDDMKNIYPLISPHPQIVCSNESMGKESVAYRTFLSLTMTVAAQ